MSKIRRLIGWLIGSWFVVNGRRRRRVAEILRSGRVLVVCAHHPSRVELARVIDWFSAQGFSFVSPEQVLQNKKRQPGRVVLTFDDGWRSNLTEVVPLLREKKIPALFFIAPQMTEDGYEWLTVLDIPGSGRTRAEWLALPNAERLTLFKNWVARNGTTHPRDLMTPDELTELARDPLFEIGNHTLTHASLSRQATSLAEALKEVDAAQRILTDWTGRIPRFMAYPVGVWRTDSETALRERGLVTFTLEPGLMSGNSAVPRNLMIEGASLMENIGRLTGAWVRVKAPPCERV